MSRGKTKQLFLRSLPRTTPPVTNSSSQEKSSALLRRRAPVYKRGSEDPTAQTRPSSGNSGGGGDSGVGSPSPTPKAIHPSQPPTNRREKGREVKEEARPKVNLEEKEKEGPVVIGHPSRKLEKEADKAKPEVGGGTKQEEAIPPLADRMVSGGATCLAASAVPCLPLAHHYQAVPIAALPSTATTTNHQNNTKMAMSAAMVDQLRQQLLLVVEKGDQVAANDIIGQLDNAALSKEILETTRIGRYVNDVRKQTADSWPEFTKRCRTIIKQWQKLAEYRPSSSCEGSSNGGTPRLISPALRRGLTPRTPGKQISQPQQQQQQRVTSTDLPQTDARSVTKGTTRQSASTSISPALALSGSYAPLPPTKISAFTAAATEEARHVVQRAASLGTALASLGNGSAKPVVVVLNGATTGFGMGPGGTAGPSLLLTTNGPAPLAPSATATAPPPSLVASAHPSQPPLMLKLKRSASGMQRLTAPSSPSSANGISPPSAVEPPVPVQQTSVQAARKNVQSTAELVAQLSEQLPQHIGGIFDTEKAAASTSKLDEMAIPKISSIAVSASTGLIVDFKAEESAGTSSSGRRRKKSPSDGDGDKERAAAKVLKTEEKPLDGPTAQPPPLLPQPVAPEAAANGPTGVAATAEDQPKVKRKRGRPRKGGGGGREPAVGTSSADTQGASQKFNWFAKFPFETVKEEKKMDEEEEQQPVEVPQQLRDQPEHSFVLPVRQRQLLVLPYLDIGRPDWLVHDMPERERFLFPE